MNEKQLPKTLEEMFIKQYNELEKNLNELNKKIEQLEIDNENLQKPFKHIDKFDFIVNEEQFYYKIHIGYASDFNACLIQNNLTPQFLKDIQEGKINVDEFIKLSWKDRYSTEKIGYIEKDTYDFIIELKKDERIKKFIIEEKYGTLYIYETNNGGYFLTEEEANKQLNIDIMDKIDSYFNNYFEKYEQEFEKTKAIIRED